MYLAQPARIKTSPIRYYQERDSPATYRFVTVGINREVGVEHNRCLMWGHLFRQRPITVVDQVAHNPYIYISLSGGYRLDNNIQRKPPRTG